MTHKEFNFHIYKTTFYGQCWKAKNTKAVVVLAHGMGEHSERYKHVAKRLNDNDFSVLLLIILDMEKQLENAVTTQALMLF